MRQAGQVLPLALAGIALLAVSTIYAYHTTRLTLEKSRLVNAADAAAYSAATEGARHMNFMAYTNRAMVANALAGGMLTTYASWARNMGMLVSYFEGGFFEKLARLMKGKAEDFKSANTKTSGDAGCSFMSRDDLQDAADDASSASDSSSNTSGTQNSSQSDDCNANTNTESGGTDQAWRKRSGALSSFFRTAGEVVGYMNIPIDVLNGLYATGQWAAWGEANSNMKSVARDIADDYDSAYQTEVSFPATGTLNAGAGFFGWMIPNRPGLDDGMAVQVPKLAANGVGPFVRQIPGVRSLLNTSGTKEMDAGVMTNYLISATEGDDQFYMFFSRGWRLCPVLGPVCAPFPGNRAIEHTDNTSVRVPENADGNANEWKDFRDDQRSGSPSAQVTPARPGGSRIAHSERAPGRAAWQGLPAERIRPTTWLMGDARAQPHEWQRVASFGGLTNTVQGGKSAIIQRALGKTGSLQKMLEKIGQTKPGQSFKFSEVGPQLLAKAGSGLNWAAWDKTQTGTFVVPPIDSPFNKHFFGGFEGGLVPFYAFGSVCAGLTKKLSSCGPLGTTWTDSSPDIQSTDPRLEEDGGANIKEDWYGGYQGIWSYFIVPSAPHLGIEAPKMQIQVTVAKTASGDSLFSDAAAAFGLELAAEEVKMSHTARSQVYYHRQPNSPYARDLGAQHAERTDGSFKFLENTGPDTSGRPRHFNQPGDNATGIDLALRQWQSGDYEDGSFSGKDVGPYKDAGMFGMMENWFGQQFTWTALSELKRQEDVPRDQGEFANAFVPFWEAKLVADN